MDNVMLDWKQRLKATLPAIAAVLEKEATLFSEEYTIYDAYLELSVYCHRLHKEGDVVGDLPRIYAFAQWCLYQPEQDLWNAAGVAFYEHLVDEPETLGAMPQYISGEVFHQISGLLEWRMDADAFVKLRSHFPHVESTDATTARLVVASEEYTI